MQSINTSKEDLSSSTGDSKKKQDLRYLNLLKYEADTCVDGFENKGYLFAPGMLAVRATYEHFTESVTYMPPTG